MLAEEEAEWKRVEEEKGKQKDEEKQWKRLEEAERRFEVELKRKELEEARWGKRKVVEIEDSREEMEKEPESSKKVSN